MTESAGKLTLTTVPVTVEKGGVTVLVGFGEFGVDLCAHAGEPGTKACGGASQPWLHQNGEVGAPSCPTSKGLYTAQAADQAGATTLLSRSCIILDAGAHAQLVEAGTSLNSIYCIPGTTTCIAAGAKGNAMYSTNVSATTASTWTSWAGPSGISPAEAIACPATTLCVLADGSVAGGGGNVYRASSLGGSFLTSFTPGNGVNSVSCPTTSFGVASQEGEGFIRYSTKPSGTSWTPVTIGTGAMKGVSCLSASFCAVIDGSGNVHVATSEAGVKESAGWKATNIDGTTALKGVACSSTTACLAVDGGGEVLKLTIAAGGAATVSKQKLEDATELTSVTCTGSTCVAIDQGGYAYTSTNGGTSWTKSHGLGSGVKSASCSSATLCAAVDSSGQAVAFIPE